MPKNTWTKEELHQFRQIADPLADDLLKAIVDQKGHQAARELFDLLIRHLETPVSELPAIAKDYLDQTSTLPSDKDMARVANAQAVFIDHGPKILLLLYFRSLPILYCMANGAEVLVQTGRLTRPAADFRTFARRIAETAQFLIAVMQPNGLDPMAEGIRYSQKVRLVHAAIRNFLQKENWNPQQLGLPINQEDMAITLMTFSVTIIKGLEHFGIDLGDDQKEDWQYTWNAVGRLLGVREELIPDNIAAARQLEELIIEDQGAASEAGELLTKALTDFVETNLPIHKINFKAEDFIRYSIGQKRATYLGIAPNTSCMGFIVPEVLGFLFRSGERLESRSSQEIQSLLDQLSRLSVKALINIFDKYKQRNISLPRSLEDAWLQ